ncbi:MAG: tetratricopeptide repeat protein [Acidobacteria bacterium]|nr:tetratricopeptide repeat protein [Acidobacteriota bacterium]
MNKRGRRLLTEVLVAALVLGSAAVAMADWQAGVAAFKKKDYSTAIKEFQEVTKTNEDFAGGYYMLGLAQSQVGQLSQALGNLRKAVELDKGNAQYEVALGQGLVQAKQYGEAYGVLKAVDRSKLSRAQRSLQALLLASAATRTNHAQDAVNVLAREARAEPSNARIQQALGVAYNALGNDANAYRAFAAAYRLDPSDEESGRSAASAAISSARRSRSSSDKMRLYNEAAAIAEKLAARHATFDHNLLVGEAWLGAKSYDRALPWFNKAKQQRPQNALVYFYIGQCHSSTGKMDQALGELQTALKMGPEGKLRRLIYDQMGYVLAKQKRYEKALDMYQSAGNNAKVQEMQASIKKQKQNEEAQQEQAEYKRKIKALLAQADELEKLGQVEEARAIRNQVKALQKND